MIRLKQTLQNGKEIKLEGGHKRDSFNTLTEFIDFTNDIEILLCANKKELTYIIEYEDK